MSERQGSDIETAFRIIDFFCGLNGFDHWWDSLEGKVHADIEIHLAAELRDIRLSLQQEREDREARSGQETQ